MVAAILVRRADSKLALLRGTLASFGVKLGDLGSFLHLGVLAILSSAGVAVGASCTILSLAVRLKDDLASFELESVWVDEAVDLPGPISCGICRSVKSGRAKRGLCEDAVMRTCAFAAFTYTFLAWLIPRTKDCQQDPYVWLNNRKQGVRGGDRRIDVKAQLERQTCLMLSKGGMPPLNRSGKGRTRLGGTYCQRAWRCRP